MVVWVKYRYNRNWTLETHFLGILANRLLVWSTIAFCRATIFEFQKFNSINAGTNASPQFSIPNTCWDCKFCIFAVPFLGPKNGPIFGAASYNSNKDGPIWRPQNWDLEIANIWPKLLIFWSRGLFLVAHFRHPPWYAACFLKSRRWSIFGASFGGRWFPELPAVCQRWPAADLRGKHSTANDFFVSFSLAPRIVGESRSALLNPNLGLVFCNFLMERFARFHIILRRPGG